MVEERDRVPEGSQGGERRPGYAGRRQPGQYADGGGGQGQEHDDSSPRAEQGRLAARAT
jgi:hypothetical protein